MGLKKARTGNGAVLTESVRAEALKWATGQLARSGVCVQEKHHLLSHCTVFPSRKQRRSPQAGFTGAQSKAEVKAKQMVDEGGEEKLRGEKHFINYSFH